MSFNLHDTLRGINLSPINKWENSGSGKLRSFWIAQSTGQ